MAKEKKSISVTELKERINKLLATPYSAHITADFKAGLINILEWSLIQANAYKGYTYLNNNNSEVGTPGYLERKYI